MSLFDKLSNAEIIEFEELSGTTIGGIGDASSFTGKVVAAFAFIIRRRLDKTTSYEQVLATPYKENIATISSINDPEDNGIDPKDTPPPAAPDWMTLPSSQ